jgi:hypothetical protein
MSFYPWRRKVRPPARREAQVAALMAECDCGAPGCRSKPITAEEIGARLGMTKPNVYNVMARIRTRLGPQAR